MLPVNFASVVTLPEFATVWISPHVNSQLTEWDGNKLNDVSCIMEVTNLWG